LLFLPHSKKVPFTPFGQTCSNLHKL
jgi:hypothetical protein